MRIETTPGLGPQPAEGHPTNPIEPHVGSGADKSSSVQHHDEVALSTDADEIRKIRGAIDEAAAARAERIQILRQAIEDGSYEIPLDALARRLLGPLA